MYMIITEVNGKTTIMATVADMNEVFNWIREVHKTCSNFNVAFYEKEMYIDSSDHDEQDDFFYTVYHCVEY